MTRVGSSRWERTESEYLAVLQNYLERVPDYFELREVAGSRNVAKVQENLEGLFRRFYPWGPL